MGYMEGALSSGFRLAHRLAVRDKLLPQKLLLFLSSLHFSTTHAWKIDAFL
jgi:hypothetical protein